MSDDELINYIDCSDGLWLIEFGSEFCIPCQQAADTVKETTAERDDISLLSVNIDERASLAVHFGVMSIPAILLVRGGKELARAEGGITKAKVAALIDKK